MRSAAARGPERCFRAEPQPRLESEGELDRLGERQRLSSGGDGLEGGFVGVAGKRHRSRRHLTGIPTPWRRNDRWW